MAETGVQAGHHVVDDRFTSSSSMSMIRSSSMAMGSPCPSPLSQSVSQSSPQAQLLAQSLPGPNTAAKGKLIQMLIQQGGASSSSQGSSSVTPLLLPSDLLLVPCSYHNNNNSDDNSNIVITLNDNDVLAGRGSRISHHPGNIAFRQFVNSFKLMYMDKSNKLLFKAHMCAHIVNHVQSLKPTPGRFLHKRGSSDVWMEMGGEKARKKAGQALREDARVIRAEWGMAQFHPQNRKGALVAAMRSGSGSGGGNDTTTQTAIPAPVAATATAGAEQQLQLQRLQEEQEQQHNLLQQDISLATLPQQKQHEDDVLASKEKKETQTSTMDDLFLAQQHYNVHVVHQAECSSPGPQHVNDSDSNSSTNKDHSNKSITRNNKRNEKEEEEHLQYMALLQMMQDQQQQFQDTYHSNTNNPIPLMEMEMMASNASESHPPKSTGNQSVASEQEETNYFLTHDGEDQEDEQRSVAAKEQELEPVQVVQERELEVEQVLPVVLPQQKQPTTIQNDHCHINVPSTADVMAQQDLELAQVLKQLKKQTQTQIRIVKDHDPCHNTVVVAVPSVLTLPQPQQELEEVEQDIELDLKQAHMKQAHKKRVREAASPEIRMMEEQVTELDLKQNRKKRERKTSSPTTGPMEEHEQDNLGLELDQNQRVQGEKTSPRIKKMMEEQEQDQDSIEQDVIDLELDDKLEQDPPDSNVFEMMEHTNHQDDATAITGTEKVLLLMLQMRQQEQSRSSKRSRYLKDASFLQQLNNLDTKIGCCGMIAEHAEKEEEKEEEEDDDGARCSKRAKRPTSAATSYSRNKQRKIIDLHDLVSTINAMKKGNPHDDDANDASASVHEQLQHMIMDQLSLSSEFEDSNINMNNHHHNNDMIITNMNNHDTTDTASVTSMSFESVAGSSIGTIETTGTSHADAISLQSLFSFSAASGRRFDDHRHGTSANSNCSSCCSLYDKGDEYENESAAVDIAAKYTGMLLSSSSTCACSTGTGKGTCCHTSGSVGTFDVSHVFDVSTSGAIDVNNASTSGAGVMMGGHRSTNTSTSTDGTSTNANSCSESKSAAMSLVDMSTSKGNSNTKGNTQETQSILKHSSASASCSSMISWEGTVPPWEEGWVI
jgi:hypothetical protein